MLASLCAILGGCTDFETQEWQGTIVDSAGVVVVTNPSSGLWSSDEAWTLLEDLRIGTFGGDPHYQFAQIGSIALNGVGGILVMDRQTQELREFTKDGDFVRVVGSPGQGPGEFGIGVTDVFAVSGDTLLVPDVRNRRVHRFGPDGAFLDAASIDVSRYRPLRFRWNAATGDAVAQLRPTRVMEEGETSIVEDELRRVESDGSLGETLLTFPAGDLLGPNVIRYFTPEPSWAVTDSLTVLYGVNDQYRIGRYDRRGDLRRVITMPHEPRQISDRDIRAFFAYLDRAWLAAGVPPSRLEANHRRVSFADHFPAFAAIHSGYDGTVWVQPVRAPGDMTDAEIERYNFIEDFGARDWDVFDREGRFLGQVAMPARFQPRLFVEDVIYGVARDDLDVQYVVRVRVVLGSAGRESA